MSGYVKFVDGKEQPMTEEEIAEFKKQEEIRKKEVEHMRAQAYRTERDLKLAECDWLVLRKIEKDIEIPAEWVTYRQALRDITKHENWPALSFSDWPNKPE